MPNDFEDHGRTAAGRADRLALWFVDAARRRWDRHGWWHYWVPLTIVLVVTWWHATFWIIAFLVAVDVLWRMLRRKGSKRAQEQDVAVK